MSDPGRPTLSARSSQDGLGVADRGGRTPLTGESAGARGPAAARLAPGAAPGGDLDGWLVRAAVGRDEGAFEQLVRRHTPALYAGALRTTGSPQLAEEVVQDAWLSAWRHLPGFRGTSTVRTWLMRIVTTTALNAVRRRSPTVALDAVPARPVASTEEEVERADRARAVRLAVAALPGRQREAVVLRDLEGLSYLEVAEVLDCSVGSVKSALHRGRQSLAAALGHYQPDPTGPDAPAPRHA